MSTLELTRTSPLAPLRRHAANLITAGRVLLLFLAAACAAAHGLPETAGSDAHTPFEVGNACVEAEAGTLDNLKRAILSRQVQIHGQVSHPIFSLYSGLRKLGVRSRPVSPLSSQRAG